MARLTQEDFNEVADYYYALQRDETACQSNRMMWIIAAQALVFTGVCTLIGSSQCYNTNECLDDYITTVIDDCGCIYCGFGRIFIINKRNIYWRCFKRLELL